MELVVLNVLILVIIALIYIIINLNKKVEKLEDIVNGYDIYMGELSKAIEDSNAKIQKLDGMKIFQTDDEIGWFFNNLKTIQEKFNLFITHYGKR